MLNINVRMYAYMLRVSIFKYFFFGLLVFFLRQTGRASLTLSSLQDLPPPCPAPIQGWSSKQAAPPLGHLYLFKLDLLILTYV